MLVNRPPGAGVTPSRQSWLGESRHCHSRRSRTIRAAFEGCQQPLPNPVKIVGLGSAGIDYLASVAAFPRPDDKLRTDKLEVQGGGNCGNALTAAARLGLSPFIVTKIGDDGMGDSIISEFEEDGVDTSCVVRAEGHPSPFTYIIVDRAGGTRTCIHTPGAPMTPDELTNDHINTLLEGAALVYFDGRLTDVAVKLAQAAKARSVPVLVEAERLRPGLELLLDEADYVVTSAHFPQAWTGEAKLADALITMVARLAHAKLFITTRGTQGSVLLARAHGSVRADLPQQSLDDLMTILTNQLRAKSMPAAANASISSTSTRAPSAPDCMSTNGIPIHKPLVAHSAGPVRLRYSAGRSAATTQAAAVAAASRAASQNADAANASRYGAASSNGSGSSKSSEVVVAGVVLCQACALAKSDVADTTGAGDSFIGSVIYGLVTGMSHERMLQLASVVAACKCTELGPRPGLPRRVNLRPDLLH